MKSKTYISAFVFLLFLVSCSEPKTGKDMIVKEINSGWTFQQASKSETYPATVPGCIHTDLMDNNLIEDPFYRTNEKEVQWVDKEDWIYQTTIKLDANILSKDNIVLDFKGLDTYADVFLNDHKILSADNMFREWEVDIKPYAKAENKLKVVLYSPIKKALPMCDALDFMYPAGNDNSQMGGVGDKKLSVFTRKAPYHYGWDWGPRLVTSGIWRPVCIEAWNAARINDLHIVQKSLTGQQAVIDASFTVTSDAEYNAELLLVDIEGRKELAHLYVQLKPGENNINLQGTINQPELWWPNGSGKQHLYALKGTLLVDGQVQNEIVHNIGLRTVKLVQQPDDKGTSFYFEVNGVPVFMKGANYIPNDVFLNRMTPGKYEDVVLRAKDANMNMLRIWGGGIYENDVFYDLCDKHGILIWQDFMFACSLYPGDDTFLANVREEAIQNVKRLRNHPCVALWCGNNEMTVAWYGWGWKNEYVKKSPELAGKLWKDYSAIFFDLLPKVCAEYDSTRFYWPSSPQESYDRPSTYTSTSGDMHYWDVWHGEKPFSEYEKIIPRFMSEYGFQSFPEMQTVKAYTEPSDRDILSEVMLAHQRHPRGNALIKIYMDRDYRTPKDFEHFLYMSHVLQAEGIRIAEEAHRRAMPYCMGSLYWQLNDVWPVASWSSTDYYGRWKAQHYFTKKAYSETLVSPYLADDHLYILIVTDRHSDIDAEIRLALMDWTGKQVWQSALPVTIKANSSKVVLDQPLASFLGGHPHNSVFLHAELVEKDRQLSENFYYFAKIKDIDLPEVKIEKKITPMANGFEITLKADRPAKNVYLYLDETPGFFSDNYFDMLPNKDYKVMFTTTVPQANFEKDLEIWTVRDSY